MAYRNVEKLDRQPVTFTPYGLLRGVGPAYELGCRDVTFLEVVNWAGCLIVAKVETTLHAHSFGASFQCFRHR